jgi:hypothetical protein
MAMKDYKTYFNDIEFLYFKDYYKYNHVTVNAKRHHGIYLQVDI